jgi:D-alanyl-D-alanine endopeptidase (penicillin-binding protein 7)
LRQQLSLFLGKSRKFLILRDFFVLYTLQPCDLLQLQARLSTMHKQIMNRLLKTAGWLALFMALASSGVNAQAAKSDEKKQRLTKSVGVKKVGSSRKTAQFVSGVRRKSVVRVSAPAKPSYGQIAGLHGAQDSLDLKSSVALVIDQDTREVLFRKNESAVLPIASLTKLMTGVIISGANLPMDEMVTITQDDVDTEKGSSSRLKVGTTLSRGDMLHLALMSSENRAAHALGRTYPGGLAVFVSLMNAKAKLLGMTDTSYVEPTGLSSRNQSSAQDLATLVNAAHADPMLRELTTSTGYQVAVGNRMLQYNNTNRLTKNPEWDIGLQKTGYITEAGQCLVMQTKIAGRKLIMVFLDSAGKLSRLGDAERVRRWVESNPVTAERKVNISTSIKPLQL